jgi:hypothetical protein
VLRDERDYLLRMIAVAAAAVARLRARLRDGGSVDDILTEARSAQSELLGRDATLLRMLDPRSAAQNLGDGQRLAQWIELLGVEADALRAGGRDQDALAIESRIAAMKTSQSATN